MNNTEKSTPLSDIEDDTLSFINAEDNLLSNEPEALNDEPETVEDEADKTENNGLIFGKFKTMEEAHKSYKEAEKAITKSAELEKQLRLYREEAEVYEREKLAKQNGFSDYMQMALEDDVWQHELDGYAIVATHTLAPQQRLLINDLIDKFRYSKSVTDMALLRRQFSPEIVAEISKDVALFKHSRSEEYEAMDNRDRNIRYNRKLGEFTRLNTSWLDSDIKKDLFNQALEISNGNVDLFILKDLIDSLENEAVNKYRKKKNIYQENSQIQNTLLEPTGDQTPKSKKKKWLTKEDFYKLTPQQETEKYELIAEQIKLEKQGVLPRMLT